MEIITIVALLAYIAFKEWNTNKQTNELVLQIRKLSELVKARSLEDVVAAEVIRKDIEGPKDQTAGTKTLDQLDDKEFDVHIKNTNNG